MNNISIQCSLDIVLAISDFLLLGCLHFHEIITENTIIKSKQEKVFIAFSDDCTLTHTHIISIFMYNIYIISNIYAYIYVYIYKSNLFYAHTLSF